MSTATDGAPASAPPRPELWRALGALVGPPTPDREPLARALELGPLPSPAEFTELFVLQLPPYASIYLGPEGMLGGEARDRIAGFWRAVGRTPPAEPDHLAVLLGLVAALGEEGEGKAAATGSDAEADRRQGRSRAPLVRHAGQALLREHLIPWLPPYLLKVEQEGASFYRRWAELLLQALEEGVAGTEGDDGAAAADHAGAPEPGTEEPTGSGPFDDLPDFLLTPARSGLILTRGDLLRSSRSRGLPLRIGERRFSLKAMLGAALDETLAWLGEEARAWEERHRRWAHLDGPWARRWEDRARMTRILLEEAAAGPSGP